MSAAQSVSHWIAQLKEGHQDAVQCLWERYAGKLVEHARRRLKNAPKRAADEDDIVVGVFHSLCRGAAAGRFENVKNRDDLWWLLLAITKQKVVDHVRHETAQKRGAGWERLASNANGGADGSYIDALEQLIGDEPSPDFAVMLAEQHQRMLDLLRDDCLRQIANARIEGLTTSEIAEELKLSTRSVERKLQLIRGVWSKELAR